MDLGFQQIIGATLIALIILPLVARTRLLRIPIWSFMAFASFISVLTGLVSWDELGVIIDLNVILFLIGMFSIVGLAESSGLLEYISYAFISRFRSRYGLILGSSILHGLLAAFTVNDTVALMGPSIAYTVSRVAGIPLSFSFILLAFSLTIGSVMTPIGNPQNMLISINSGLQAPFPVFMYYLTIPTMINLVLTPLVLIKIYGIRDESVVLTSIPSEHLKSRRDAMLALIGLVVAVIALVLNDFLALYGLPHISGKGFIPFIIAAGIYIFTTSPRDSLLKVDWGTIMFFITMFITTEGIWRSGIIQPVLDFFSMGSCGSNLSVVSITLSSLLISQVLSNVPFVNLYIGYLKTVGCTGSNIPEWLTLASMSTIAGNLMPLGAASNIIIMEYLESKYRTTLSFKEFVKAGALVTLINTLIYYPFLLLISL
jgi:Na+/H+ antiporter NhaD/arsenite permease-like protein